MTTETVLEAVYETHDYAVASSIDVLPSDVGKILSYFMRALARAQPELPAVDTWLETIADECEGVKDE